MYIYSSLENRYNYMIIDINVDGILYYKSSILQFIYLCMYNQKMLFILNISSIKFLYHYNFILFYIKYSINQLQREILKKFIIIVQTRLQLPELYF